MILVTTLILIGFTILLWLRWRRSMFTVFKDLGIPGPEPSIFFGNVMEMAKKGSFPCQTDWINKYGDVLGFYYGTRPTLLVSNTELLKQILIKDFSSFTDRPRDYYAIEGDRPKHSSSHHMINNRGRKWKEVRSLVTPSFTTGKLKQMTPLLKDSVNTMVSKLEAASENGTKEVEMYELFRGMTMDTIGRVAFGIDSSVQDTPDHPLIKLAKMLIVVRLDSLLNILFVSFREFDVLLQPFRIIMFALYNKGSNPLKELCEIIRNVVKQRKENPKSRRPDLVQSLIDARSSNDKISDSSLIASGDILEVEVESENTKKSTLSKNEIRLTDVEVEANSFIFLLAGYETTSTAMAFLIHDLVNNIPVQDKMREEIVDIFGKDGDLEYELLGKMQYTDRVIYESLRLIPPIYSFCMRVPSRDVQLGKWKIPAGMTIQIPLHNIHNDPNNFEDPTTFNPDRFLPENRGENHSVTSLQFGAGPRNCVGMRFALMQMKMALVTMIRKFKLEPCAKTELGSVAIYYAPAFASPEKGVHVKAVPIP